MKHGSLVLFALFGAAGLAHAGLIDITEQATASGVLNGTHFTNALVTLDFEGDTSFLSVAPTHVSLNGAGAVTVAGVGSDIFTNTIQAYSNPTTGSVGMWDVGVSEVMLETDNVSLIGYGMTTSIGPVVGSAFLSGQSYTTSGGSFRITAITVIDDQQDSTLTATVSPTDSAPEPGSFLLAAAGIAALMLRRKKLSLSEDC